MDSPLCPKCQTAKASTRKSKLCATCHKNWLAEQPKAGLLIDQAVIAKAAMAKTTDDWQKLATELAPTFAAILSGDVKATAAQASLLKDVYNRAFGKPTATQTEKRVAAGVIILPALDTGMKMMICPKCGFDIGYDPKNSVGSQSGTTNDVPSIDS